MTNYSERLDKIFKTLDNKAREKRASCIERNNWEGYSLAYERLENEAKQAITSLIKELVAEAKPSHKTDTRGATQNSDNAFYHTKRARGYNEATREFEQNLLKALEEVK